MKNLILVVCPECVNEQDEEVDNDGCVCDKCDYIIDYFEEENNDY